jgi:hypothetical protein
MNRNLAITLAGLGLVTLAACATSDTSSQSYSLGRGVVNYDELRRVGDKCKADGGTSASQAGRGRSLPAFELHLRRSPEREMKRAFLLAASPSSL